MEDEARKKEQSQRLWERVNFALSYPFIAPEHDYVFYRDHALEIAEYRGQDPRAWRVVLGDALVALGELLDRDGVASAPLSSLTPVVASGSNASPLQLNRKFHSLDKALCPCFRVTLPGYEARYAAHIAPYGSVPASLERAERHDAAFFVSFLPDAYLAEMHRTESLGRYYNVIEISDLHIERPGLDWKGAALGYASASGVLLDETLSKPLALSEASQWRAQAATIRHLGESISVQDFVRQNILDVERRLSREAALSLVMAESAKD